ncbi:MAG: histidinol-phosphatase, partial [Firmicutes bacterium]|nr:histidinol-phosphatase [Bacillota bacterium]
RGVSEVGFTEHSHNFRESADLLNHPEFTTRHGHGFRVDDYIGVVVGAREEGYPVRLGIEMDYIEERRGQIQAFISEYPWDFVIGSVHWLGDWGFDIEPGSWDGRDVDEAYRTYFSTVERAVLTGMFDVLGHADVIKVFGHRPSREFQPELLEWFDRIADALARTGACLEVSSAGLRRVAREAYPDTRLLSRARARNVPITISSDAHEPEEVGLGFEVTIPLVRSLGFQTLTVFNCRRGRQERIG